MIRRLGLLFSANEAKLIEERARGVPTQPMGQSSRYGKALSALVSMRIVYAVNWLNVGAIFTDMAAEFHLGVTGLGALNGSFFVGIALFQVPAGILAARWGSKKITVVGTMVASAAALLCGLAASIDTITALRFVVGAGMALVFAPAVVIVANYFRTGNTRTGAGIGVGIFNSAFDVGGIIALFGWAILAEEFGWRTSLLTSGMLGIITGLLVVFMVPGEEQGARFEVRATDLKTVLFDRRLVIVGLGMLATTIGNTLVGGFMVYYLQQSFGLGAAPAGAIASLVVAAPIFSAIFGGRLYDRISRPRFLMLAANLVMALSVAVAAANSVWAAVLASLVCGITSGVGFTVGFAAARDLNRSHQQYDSLAIAWVNCISLFGGFPSSILFADIAGLSGYPTAWLVGGAMSLAIGLPILFLRLGKAREGSR